MGRIALAVVACAACDGESPPPCAPSWSTLVDDSDPEGDDLGAAVLGVWGASADDVWFGGGTLGVEPRASFAMHFDGQSFERVAIDVPQSFWWVTRTPEGTVWFVGEEGVAVRWDGTATVYDTGAPTTLFGAWGCSDSDVWAAGGDVGPGEKDVIVHFDGESWTRVPSPEPLDVQFLKVWGASCEDVWIVGAGGAILHWDGAAWTREVATDSYGEEVHTALFGISGRAVDDVWVAGAGSRVLHRDADGWTEFVSADGDLFGGTLQGVFAVPDGDVFAVGVGGVKLVLEPDGGHRQETLEGTTDDLHAVWADAAGTAFAVGGDYFDMASDVEVRMGTIARRGCEIDADGLPAPPP